MNEIAAGTPFTPRERQLAQLVTQGKLNKQIAGELDLKEGTVAVYLATMFRKAGVSTRTGLAVMALKDPERFLPQGAV